MYQFPAFTEIQVRLWIMASTWKLDSVTLPTPKPIVLKCFTSVWRNPCLSLCNNHKELSHRTYHEICLLPTVEWIINCFLFLHHSVHIISTVLRHVIHFFRTSTEFSNFLTPQKLIRHVICLLHNQLNSPFYYLLHFTFNF